MIKSLNGLRVLNTRPKNQGQILSKQITEAGGVAIDCPTIEIKACSECWINKLPPLDKVDQAIFISANAVEYCFLQLKAQPIDWPKSIHVIAIGDGTTKALKKYRIIVHDVPKSPDSEHLLTLPCLQKIDNQTLLLFKGEGGRSLIEERLVQKNANLFILPVYQRVAPTICQQFIKSIWQDDAADIILVTSEQSIHNLFKLFSTEAHSWLQNKTYLVISDRLAQVASLFGIKKIKISHPSRIINTLFHYKD